ncbi:MAG: DUF1428 domain-containing protein [Halomonas sp.]|uniref:DUF1428 domain-containing protein n=1 Tax=Halomonas sp. TaxID=1486246 RepID=UPI003F929BD9
MTYFTGAVAAVPTANKDKYAHHVATAWPMFKAAGAVRMVEIWGVDVPDGKITDFYGAVGAKDSETIVFSWIEWPKKATADAMWQKMEESGDTERMPEMPFDGSRMIYGGFSPIYEAGTDIGAGYYQGFLTPVPAANKKPYTQMAEEGWKMFKKGGAIGMVEAWGIDVPHGKVTDFYRATKAEEGEVPVFSWAVWPDRATCDAAKAMEAEMPDMDVSGMPFDGMRMMWAGFEPLFDTASLE